MTRGYGKAVEMSVSRFYAGRTISALLVPQMFARKPELIFNMEQVRIGSWDKGSMPYCTVDRLEASGTAESLHLRLHGKLDAAVIEPGLQAPYELHLTFTAEPYRVRVHGEMVKLDVPLTAYGPCLQTLDFSRENLPAFEMARKSFMYFEDKGFTWLSDAQRTRSERHQDPPVDDGGPWIQLFTTHDFIDNSAVVRYTTRKEVAAAPLAGWVANDDAYLVAVAGRNAYQGGIRWGPCLHSNMACDLGAAGHDPTFDQVIYTTPVDLELLLEMVQEDFPHLTSAQLGKGEDTLWPYNRGLLVNSFEGADRECWQVSQGTLAGYRSDRMWINGNMERVTFPEGVTEGAGSTVWEIAAGADEARLWGRCDLDAGLAGQVTHLGIDVLNRGAAEPNLTLTVEAKQQVIAEQGYHLREWSNQRLLLPLPKALDGGEFQVSLKVGERAETVKIVLDNLRAFMAGS